MLHASFKEPFPQTVKRNKTGIPYRDALSDAIMARWKREGKGNPEGNVLGQSRVVQLLFCQFGPGFRRGKLQPESRHICLKAGSLLPQG